MFEKEKKKTQTRYPTPRPSFPARSALSFPRRPTPAVRARLLPAPAQTPRVRPSSPAHPLRVLTPLARRPLAQAHTSAPLTPRLPSFFCRWQPGPTGQTRPLPSFTSSLPMVLCSEWPARSSRCPVDHPNLVAPPASHPSMLRPSRSSSQSPGSHNPLPAIRFPRAESRRDHRGSPAIVLRQDHGLLLYLAP